MKIRYIIKNKHTQQLHIKVYDVESIERGLSNLFDVENYDIVARNICSMLPDTNGELIFEGDIIVHEGDNKPCLVSYVKRGCVMGWETDSKDGIHSLGDLMDNVTVIGNEYLNPELMKL